MEKLYLKYNSRLTSFIKTFVNSSDDVQDILQNTFINILNSLHTYCGQSQLFTWMCGIARHKIADYYRTSYKKEKSLEDLTGESNWNKAVEDSSFSIDDWLLSVELSNTVRAIIGTMPEHYQNILIDKYIYKKTIKEIAATNNMSEKAAESLNMRARKLFKQLVAENDYFSGGGIYG